MRKARMLKSTATPFSAIARSIDGPGAAPSRCGRPFDRGDGQVVEIEAIANDLQKPQFLLLDMKVGRGDLDRQCIGGIVPAFRQTVRDEVENGIEAFLAEHGAACFGNGDQFLAVEFLAGAILLDEERRGKDRARST